MKVPFVTLPLPNDPNFQYTINDLLRRLVDAVNDAEVRTGPTTDRPTGADLRAGRAYFDTTLGQPVWYDGAAWVDATGTAA